MSASHSKTTKSKSNSNKKSRKPVRETDVQENSKLTTQSTIGIQTSDNKTNSSEHSAKKSSRDSAICKSLENIMHLKNVNRDTISMSKTDISIVYGMYKTLIQKCNVNNELHTENYQILLNELRTFQSQLNEQELYNKSLVNLVTTLICRHRMDRRIHRKRSDRVNKMLMLKLSQIAAVIYKIQGTVHSLEIKNSTLDAKIDESVAAVNLEKLQKTKKKSSFCCCM